MAVPITIRSGCDTINLTALGSERPFNEITNSIKWNAANVG